MPYTEAELKEIIGTEWLLALRRYFQDRDNEARFQKVLDRLWFKHYAQRNRFRYLRKVSVLDFFGIHKPQRGDQYPGY